MKTYLYRILSFIFFIGINISVSASVQIQIAPVCSNHSNCDTYEFTASGIRSEFQNYNGDYRIFWSFGDGFCHDGVVTLNATSPDAAITHTFSSGGNHEIYVEAVPLVYEDNKPPKRFNNNFGGSNLFSPSCGNCSPVTTSLNSFFKNETNRKFVPGDMVSIILTYSNYCNETVPQQAHGTIKFKFPTDYLMVDIPPIYDQSSIYSEQSAPNSLPTTFITGGFVEFEWNFSGLNFQELRNIIIPLKVAANAPLGHPFNFETYVFIESDDMSCKFEKTILTGGLVNNSHDPNDLLSDLGFTCDTAEINTVRYTIRFRNDGTGAADSVLIKNVIPDFFDPTTIKTVYPVYNSDPLAHTYINGTREARWDLRGYYLKANKGLRGTMESGFGQTVFLEDCVDSVVYIIKKKTTEQISKCNAIVNQAEIIFDCNPSFYTNPHIFRFGCLDTIFDVNSPVPGQIDSIVCDTCAEISIIYDTLNFTPGSTPVPLTVNQAFLPIGDLEYRWYPSTGLNNYQMLQPTASPMKSTDYFLVASSRDSCGRSIFQVRVEIPCNLEISHKVSCDQSGNSKTIFATVNSTSPHLKWQDCSFNDSFELSGIANKYFYLSVVDTLTNCSATKRVGMICPKVFPWGTLAGLLLVAVALAYVLHLSGWWP